MSEHGKPKFEQRDHLLAAPEHHPALPDAEHAEPLRPGEVDPLTLKKARLAAHEAAEPARNVFEDNQTIQEADRAAQPSERAYVNRELKAITLRRELQSLRRQLPLADRWLSRAVHQPAVRRASEVTSQSLTRPAGLLGGGIVAFLGSVSYLYLARHIGFSYNYLVMGVLFVAGFGLGLVLELAVWLLASRHRGD